MTIVVTIVVVLLVLAGAAAYLTLQRSPDLRARMPWARHDDGRRLRQRSYGREYERLYTVHGDHAAVARELDRREQRRRELPIAKLEGTERDRFAFDWAAAQAGFVDDPGGATRRAEQLVGRALAARGYPGHDAEEQLALASVDHPHTLSEFRDGHEFLQRSLTGAPGVDATEQLRQAMLRFRVFFDDLVGARTQNMDSSAAARKERERVTA
jgi:hypothetical protein